VSPAALTLSSFHAIENKDGSEVQTLAMWKAAAPLAPPWTPHGDDSGNRKTSKLCSNNAALIMGIFFSIVNTGAAVLDGESKCQACGWQKALRVCLLVEKVPG
jgi:hypothetical protein